MIKDIKPFILPDNRRLSLSRLLICCSIWFLLPMFTVSAVNYRNIPKRYQSTIDSPLEATFEVYIKGQRKRRVLASTERTSFVVYDLTKGQKLVSINEERPMMAASLIKNFVMLAYFHEVKQGRKAHTALNRKHLKKMIQSSSNPSTNHFIRLLGGPRRVNQILRANYRYFKQTRIVEYIPTNGRTYRNRTCARDLNKFYVQLWGGSLPHSDKMKYYLGLKNGDYIYKRTNIPASVRVYNKTGTVYGLVGDSGVLILRDPRGNSRPYIFTGMIEDTTKTRTRNRRISFGAWVTRRANILRRLSERAYWYIYENNYGGRRARR